MCALTLPGNLDALSPIRDYVKAAANTAGLDHTATYKLLLAVDEIATNVVVHGYEEAGLQGDISITAKNEGNRLVIEMLDHGKSYDPNSHQMPDDQGMLQDLSERPIGGLGIMLAKDGVDDLEYHSSESENVHRFIVHLTPPAKPANPVWEQAVSDDQRKLKVLLRISKSLGCEVRLDPLLQLIVEEVTTAMEAERSTLFLVDRRKPDQLVSRVAEGLGSKEIRVLFGIGIAGTTAQTRQVINIPDAYKDPRFNPAFDKSLGFRTRSILSTPIIDQTGVLIGVVEVMNRKGRAFTEDDEQFLEAICVDIALALKRAEMVDAYLQSQILTTSLELAREIQMGLLPKDFPALPELKEVDIHATIIPTFEVGGDLYDFFPLDKDRLCFVIGDVSDKGIPAALFMAMTRTAFKMSALAAPESIGHTMARVNRFLCDSNPQQMFVTALAGILDLKTGRVEYADAGHEPPFILQAAGGVLKVDKVGGLVLGFIRDEEFRTGSMQLNPGDTLVLYTDGVTEAMNVKHELFGADAIEKTLSLTGQTAASQTIIQVLLQGMRVFVGEAEQHDDIAILAIRYLGPSNN